MFEKLKKIEILNKSIDKLNQTLLEMNASELFYILGKRSEIIKRNLIAGIFRGVGIGIGVTLVSAMLIWLLQRVVKWNLPIIGQYLADIVDIVQKNL